MAKKTATSSTADSAKTVQSSTDPIRLGISVDESFAEFSLIRHPFHVLASHRVYLARENLKNALPAFLAAHAKLRPQRAFVSARFLEKILDYRLGGSVAQLVSDGFENWMQIRSTHPQLHNLSNPDLIFSVRERVTADGQVQDEINVEDLEIIEAKLKLMEVKRVCLHFLHSQIQPKNLAKAQKFFEERGFDVFIPAASDNPDEVSRWRANTLNASISGTFLELKEQIEEACKDLFDGENIFFLSSQGQLFQNEKHFRLGSLFSTRTAVLESETDTNELLYLGLEKFSWLQKSCEPFWQSPWGQVELEHTSCVDLQIQPTSQIDVNLFSELDFSEKPESYEPGPMCMGRGQKPTLLDLFSETEALKNITGLSDRITAPGVQRFRNTLIALSKSTATKRNVEIDRLIQQLRHLALQRMALEVHLKNPAHVKVAGPLATVFGPALKELFPEWELIENEFIDSTSVARTGRQWLEKRAEQQL